MNKTNKKFKKLLEKRFRELKTEIEHSYVNFTKNVVCMHPTPIIYKDEKKTAELHQLSIILDVYKKPLFFEDFQVLQSYLDLYKFEPEEQAEVISFFLNLYINFALNVDFNDYPDIIAQYAQASIYFSDDDGMVSEEIIDVHKKFQQMCLNLRTLISSDGALLPLTNATFLKKDLVNMLSLTEEQINLIISISELRAKRIMDEALERYAITMAQYEKENSEKLKVEPQIIRTSKKDVGVAKKQLRQFLVNDTPIRFITEEELVIVINLLKTLGYTEKSINIIRKNILLNNQVLLVEANNIKIKTAEEKYLSESEKELLANTKSLLENEEVIKNKLYNEIAQWYNTIRSLLLNLDKDESTFKDNYDYLLLCIEELGTLMSAYKVSNYKLILNLDSN